MRSHPKRSVRMSMLAAAASACLGVAAGGSGAFGAPEPAAVPPGTVARIPAVEPVPPDGNLPLNSAVFAGSMDYGDLARFGYVEREYYFSGTASTRDQETGAVLKANLPYVSRLVVRMPLNPKHFSGNVILEPFHPAYEKADMWTQLHRYMTERGDAWVGYTMKAYGSDMEPESDYILGGVPMLKAYDPVRYGRLHLEPDLRPFVVPPPTPMPPQALDLMAQVGALIKSNAPDSPLRGLVVKKLYSIGTGINGDVMQNYIRLGMHENVVLPNGGQIFDGYLYGNTFRLPPKPPRNAAHIMFRGLVETSRAAISGFEGAAPNTPSYKVYDVIGMSHMNERNLPFHSSTIDQINAVLPQPTKTMPHMPWVIDTYGKCPHVSDDPTDLFLAAMFVRMEEWGKNGTPLPDAPLPDLAAGDPGATMWDSTGKGDPEHQKKVAFVKTDPATGNMLGGVRMPWIAAPVAMYPMMDPADSGQPAGPRPGDGMVANGAAAPPPPPAATPEPVDAWPRASKEASKLPHRASGGTFCFIYQPRLPYDKQKLQTLYKNYDDYVYKFDQAKTIAVEKGWLLKEDAETLQPRGAPEDFTTN